MEGGDAVGKEDLCSFSGGGGHFVASGLGPEAFVQPVVQVYEEACRFTCCHVPLYIAGKGFRGLDGDVGKGHSPAVEDGPVPRPVAELQGVIGN